MKYTKACPSLVFPQPYLPLKCAPPLRDIEMVYQDLDRPRSALGALYRDPGRRPDVRGHDGLDAHVIIAIE